MAYPTIVIVHAATQPPPLYQPLSQALQQAGFSVEVIDYPSVGDHVPKMEDNREDIAAVRATVSSLVEAERDVLLLMHSYGGIPGTGALEGLSKSQRQKFGMKGGVIRLVYATSFALRKGETVHGAGEYENIEAYGTYFEDTDTMCMNKEPAMYTCFHDLDKGEHWFSLTKKQSVAALWSKQEYEAWKDIPSTYVYCTHDRVIPLEEQARMVKNVREVHPEAFDVEEYLETGHNPVLSKINELVIILKKAAVQ
ncbi:MAG: hypothetical protein M1821_005351 [Bathelium mastoideum]|nr:MAG: hypothetical protein M1821_005351 [Bathelium mastoideum]KAI9688099.1 MAG: hypothetical protein M1822_001605 [Bathelium mastoideum]